MRVKVRLLAFVSLVLLFGIVLGGCLDTRDWYPESKYHILILHPPHYEWDDESRELKGHFILSNIHPEPSDESHIADLHELRMTARFYDGFDDPGGALFYTMAQSVAVAPGESKVFNFTFSKLPQVSTVTSISVSILPGYTYCCGEEWAEPRNPEGLRYVYHRYVNECLGVENGVLVQKYSGGFWRDDSGDRVWHSDRNSCELWNDHFVNSPNFRIMIGARHFPPPEVWLDWTGMEGYWSLDHWPQFRDAVEFLQDFDYDMANIVYFNGEIR